MNALMRLTRAVRSDLAYLEDQARAFTQHPSLAPDKERDLYRIQERIRDLHRQLAMIADKPAASAQLSSP